VINTVTVVADPFQPPRSSEGFGGLVNVKMTESPFLGFPCGPPPFFV
jgi:hypothetical protein